MKKRKFADGGIYTAGMGQPPMEPDDASATPAMKRPMPRPTPVKPTMTKPPMPKPPMKRPAPKGSGIFREGMQVPQDIDGASVKLYKKGGSVSASRRADGIASKGKTKGKMIAMCGGGKM
jgi:hypothetical protein